MDVLHNPAKSRFEVPVEGTTAVLEYRLNRQGQKGTLTITHTFVPNAARGQGVAGRLTQEALEYARLHDLEVVPLCSFAVAYVARQRRAGRA